MFLARRLLGSGSSVLMIYSCEEDGWFDIVGSFQGYFDVCPGRHTVLVATFVQWGTKVVFFK